MLGLPLPSGRVARCRVRSIDGAAVTLDARPFARTGYRTVVRYALDDRTLCEAPVEVEIGSEPRLVAVGEPRVRADRRRGRREQLQRVVHIQPLRSDGSRTGLPLEGILLDVSPSGAGVACPARLLPGELVEVWRDGLPAALGRVTRQSLVPVAGRVTGIAFADGDGSTALRT